MHRSHTTPLNTLIMIDESDSDGSVVEYQPQAEMQLELISNGRPTYEFDSEEEAVWMRLLGELQSYRDPHLVLKAETHWDFVVLNPKPKIFTFLVVDNDGVSVVIPGDLGTLYPVARLGPLEPNDTTIASLLTKNVKGSYRLTYQAKHSACARLNAEYNIMGEYLFAKPGSEATCSINYGVLTTQTCEAPDNGVERGSDTVYVTCEGIDVASYPSNIPTKPEQCIALQETMGYNPWWTFSSKAGQIGGKRNSAATQAANVKESKKPDELPTAMSLAGGKPQAGGKSATFGTKVKRVPTPPTPPASIEIKVRPSRFRELGTYGDFLWEIKKNPFSRELYVFNDNNRDHLGVMQGAGSATIRPFNTHNLKGLARSAGICTGRRPGPKQGYQVMNDAVRQIIDRDVFEIKELLSTGKYDTVVYSTGKDSDLIGTGIFKVGAEVLEYITKQIISLGGKYEIAAGSPERRASSGTEDARYVKTRTV